MSINAKIGSWAVTGLILVLFLVYFFRNIKDFELLLHIHPLFITLLACTGVASIVINGIFIKWSISLFGKRLGWGESVRVSLISTAGNFFAPSGSGLGFRALYLKKRHKLAYSDYLSIVLCNYVIVFIVNALLGLVALYMLQPHVSQSFAVLVVFFVGLFVVSIAALFLRIKKKRSDSYRNRWMKTFFEILERMSKGWSLILNNKVVMTKLLLLVLLGTGVMLLSTFFIMKSLSINLTFSSIILFSVLGSLSVFINITPGNLGVKEAVYIVFSAIIGLSTTQILSASLVDRGVLFAVLFLLWIIYGKRVYRAMSFKHGIQMGEDSKAK